MITKYVNIQARDPIIARDGRPFGETSGHRMRSLKWPLPSVAAGSLRTLLGRMLGGNFDDSLIASLKALVCRGPLLVKQDRLFVPAPNDLLMNREKQLLSLRPTVMAQGSGMDLPPGLRPVLAAGPIGKVVPGPAWWSIDKMVEWLLTGSEPRPDFFQDQTSFCDHPKQDERTHLKIDPKTLASEEGMLFSTTGLVLDSLRGDTSLAMTATCGTDSVLLDAWQRLPALQPFGGERRVAEFLEAASQQSLWKCPVNLQGKLALVQPGTRLRMVLASPAIFAGGWRPGWLNDASERIGTPPGLRSGDLKLKLVAVANQRWEPVSGWSYEALPPRNKPGPKPIRRMVPAGGVYFFEVVASAGVNWDELWLSSVSDDLPDRQDGFGVALWGLWDGL